MKSEGNSPGEGRPAVILLSGGMDSTTTLAVAREQGYTLYALTISYGQQHVVELEAARRVARAAGVKARLELPLDLRAIGGSALTSSEIAVPKGRAEKEIGQEIPVTYVPARNTLFLSLALAWAEVLEAVDIFVGVSAVDYSGYPDCRPEFIEAFERLANVATRQGTCGPRPYRIHAPLIALDKAQTILLGQSLGVDYGLTWTCYDPQPGDLSCGQCDACLLRVAAFEKLGQTDPLPYAAPAKLGNGKE